MYAERDAICRCVYCIDHRVEPPRVIANDVHDRAEHFAVKLRQRIDLDRERREERPALVLFRELATVLPACARTNVARVRKQLISRRRIDHPADTSEER